MHEVQVFKPVHDLQPVGHATHPLELSKKNPASQERGAKVTFSQTPLVFKYNPSLQAHPPI